jgi:hypothetical protein
MHFAPALAHSGTLVVPGGFMSEPFISLVAPAVHLATVDLRFPPAMLLELPMLTMALFMRLHAGMMHAMMVVLAVTVHFMAMHRMVMFVHESLAAKLTPAVLLVHRMMTQMHRTVHFGSSTLEVFVLPAVHRPLAAFHFLALKVVRRVHLCIAAGGSHAAHHELAESLHQGAKAFRTRGTGCRPMGASLAHHGAVFGTGPKAGPAERHHSRPVHSRTGLRRGPAAHHPKPSHPPGAKRHRAKTFRPGRRAGSMPLAGHFITGAMGVGPGGGTLFLRLRRGRIGCGSRILRPCDKRRDGEKRQRQADD